MQKFSCGQKRLVKSLLRSGAIGHPAVEQAMLAVDRIHFYDGDPLYAYADSPQSIGHGATISAPHMHAIALSCLAPKLLPGARTLDVGSGSGYVTACMAHLVGPTDRVVGVERVPELVAKATTNLTRCPATRGLIGVTVTIETGDGRLGRPGEALFDVIHVGAAAGAVPSALIGQLAPGGRMVCPEGRPEGPQTLIQLDRPDQSSGEVRRRRLMRVTFVPLTA